MEDPVIPETCDPRVRKLHFTAHNAPRTADSAPRVGDWGREVSWYRRIRCHPEPWGKMFCSPPPAPSRPVLGVWTDTDPPELRSGSAGGPRAPSSCGAFPGSGRAASPRIDPPAVICHFSEAGAVFSCFRSPFDTCFIFLPVLT